MKIAEILGKWNSRKLVVVAILELALGAFVAAIMAAGLPIELVESLTEVAIQGMTWVAVTYLGLQGGEDITKRLREKVEK